MPDRSKKNQGQSPLAVIKLGTRLLTAGTEEINTQVLENLASQVAEQMEAGFRIVCVTSGAVTAGELVLRRTKQGRTLNRKGVVRKQALSALGQHRLMMLYTNIFAKYGVETAQVLISRDDLKNRAGYLNVRDTLLALLHAGALPIVNENDTVAVHELVGEVYGDNDRLAAMVANAVDADMTVLLGETDGLYTADPNANPGAKLIPVVEQITPQIQALSGKSNDPRGSGGMESKIEAAKLAGESGIPLFIASGNVPNVITRILNGEHVGTLFPSHVSRMEARRRWMMTGFIENKGRLIIDEGAVKAVSKNGMSLLPVGVTGVAGHFERGDIIGIVDVNGHTFGFGVSSYSSEEIRKIKGEGSHKIMSLLGHSYGSEVVHRNNMVVTSELAG